ncbi:MAG: M4 family metallopeptidase [Candidatus Protochlamydia sp.]|nr:M4 family metallopeptidase [Candidatus Protochlamydia sp.]
MQNTPTFTSSFVGKCTFETGLTHCKSKEKQKWVDHHENEIKLLSLKAINQGETYDSSIVKPIRKELLGFAVTRDIQKSLVYTAKNIPIIDDNSDPFGNELSALIRKVTKSANLQRQNTGNLSGASQDPVVNQAFDITETTRKFYKDVHSVDLNQLLGGTRPLALRSIVHYGGVGSSNTGFDNAFWWPKDAVMVYGDGRGFNPLVSEPSVGVHEISHMFTQQAAGTALSNEPTGLDYTGDAGGLNEANSDQGAVAALQWHNKQNDPTDDKLFRIGTGLFRNDKPEFALRDMANPGQGYKGAKFFGDDPQEGYEIYTNWSADSKSTDPHLSSAVGNKWYRNAALYLYQKNFGSTWETIEKVRVATLPTCKPNITYPEYAAETIKVAKKMHPESDYFWQAIAAAWKDVQVTIK